MGPIDYSAQVQDPFQAVLKGYQSGSGIRDDIQQQQAYQVAQQQALAQRDMQSRVLNSLITNKNATASDYANASLLVPGLKDQLKQSWEMKSSDQQQSQLRDVSQVYAAVSNGRPDLAAQKLNERAAALEAAGGTKQEVQALKAQAEAITAHPEFARATVGMMLASLPGGEKLIAGASGLGVEQRAADKAPAELAKAQAEAVKARGEAGLTTFNASVVGQRFQMEQQKQAAEIENISSTVADRTARLGLDKDKLLTDAKFKMAEMNRQFGELPPDARKNLNDSSAQAIASEQSASQILSLATRLDAAGGGYGAFGSANEWIKKATGSQDGMTALRQEYTRIRSQGVMKALPPGPATDRDVALAMEGFPPPNADAKQLASFLRGMAKLQTYDAALNNAKAQWFGEVQHLGNTKKDIEIEGIKVPAGTDFNAFAKKYLDSSVTKKTNEATIKSSPYGVFANPPAAGGATGGF